MTNHYQIMVVNGIGGARRDSASSPRDGSSNDFIEGSSRRLHLRQYFFQSKVCKAFRICVSTISV